MSSYQYKNSHYKDKTVPTPSHLYNENSYTGNTSSLYWIGSLFRCIIFVVFSLCNIGRVGPLSGSVPIAWISANSICNIIFKDYLSMDIHVSFSSKWLSTERVKIMNMKSISIYRIDLPLWHGQLLSHEEKLPWEPYPHYGLDTLYGVVYLCQT